MNVQAPSPTDVPLAQRQIHVVSGKGGVGKSAISCALALYFQSLGKRVLLAQVNAADSHQWLLETDAIPDDVTEISQGLYVVNTRPDQALREYGMMTLKFERVYKAAFENRLMKQFLRFVPSLAELTMLGKLWFHAEETTPDGARRFDHVVIDAPSTGHGLGFLRVSQIMREIVRTGPIHEKTSAMASTFADHRRSTLHVVTIPEEMPVNETLEFIDEAKRTQTAPLGFLFVNGVLPSLVSSSAREELVPTVDVQASDTPRDDADKLFRVLQRRAVREHLSDHQRHRLREGCPEMPTVELPVLYSRSFGRPEVSTLASHLATTLGDNAT